MTTPTNEPVPEVNYSRFAGKWYSLKSIPTPMDKDWRETTETYTLNDKGNYDVLTTYRKVGKSDYETIKSTLFTSEKEPGDMKAQFLWPFKIGYRIIELAPDYSYTVVGHPKEKYLFIMSRTPAMSEKRMSEIIARCKERGYDTEKLTSQEHPVTPATPPMLQ